MCNCNKLMLDYESKITVPAAKKKKIQDSKDVLRKRIVDYFKGNHPDYKPKFAIQGSYIMKTTIVTKDEECDLDDGVYFLRDVDVTATTLQKWVKNALDGATTEPVQHRSKCLRVDYKADYHIDFPVYIFPEDDDHPSIAIKDTGFEESDPKEVKDWYAKKKKENTQLNRIVKELKGWCDHKRQKMPSGLAMTILGANHQVKDDRDDKALQKTLEAIKKELDSNFKCKVPGTPHDDLFEDYSDARKTNFLDNLDLFVEDAKEAVEVEKNQLKASRLWQKHLGDKFPDGEDVDMDKKEKELKALKASILSNTAYSQKDNTITEDSSGVKNQPHKNYGG